MSAARLAFRLCLGAGGRSQCDSDHGGGDTIPLSAGERKTLTLTVRSPDEKYIAGWNKGAVVAY